MFDFLKSKTKAEDVKRNVETVAAEIPKTQPTQAGLFSRLKNQLSKSREAFTANLTDLFLGKKQIDDDLLEELETLLLQADVGYDASTMIIEALTEQVSRKALQDPAALLDALADQLLTILTPVEHPLETVIETPPFVILVVGINGAGKTTSIGKLAHFFQMKNQKLMLAAGDTFRAAAVEQLQTWGERNNLQVMAQNTGADSAAVIFDAIHSAKAKSLDLVIADTAGRLHTQTNLMDELKKVKRVIQKCDLAAPHEVLLVLDASIGQNALNQARQFNEAVGVTGLIITKLDGTAKGGVIFNLAQTLGIPVRFIGVGERIDDLQVFNAKDFVNAFLDRA